MLAASPALFPSAAPAKPQQNNPGPVTKRGGRGKERGGGGGGREGVQKKKKVERSNSAG